MIEKIIIDGVDVSGCIDYCKRDKVSCLHLLSDKCSENPNCYYKQLQRATSQYNAVLEQNKSLQSDILLARSEVSQKTDYIREQLEIIKQLKDKNRELRIETTRLSNERTIDIKKQLKQKENELAHQKTLTETYRACYLAKYEDLAKELESKKQECEELKEYIKKDLAPHAQMLQKKLDSYKQALDEIENIVNELHYSTLYFHSGKTHTLADRIQKTRNQIHDIINKAKGKNDE